MKSKNVHNQDTGSSVERSNKRIEDNGEVFTPDFLCHKMIDCILDHDLKNYNITFSDSGRNDSDIKAAIASGHNVAVVFQDHLPRRWMQRRVINGDKHDLRFKDPDGVIVGLVAKGQGRKINNKFIKAVA